MTLPGTGSLELALCPSGPQPFHCFQNSPCPCARSPSGTALCQRAPPSRAVWAQLSSSGLPLHSVDQQHLPLCPGPSAAPLNLHLMSYCASVSEVTVVSSTPNLCADRSLLPVSPSTCRRAQSVTCLHVLCRVRWADRCHMLGLYPGIAKGGDHCHVCAQGKQQDLGSGITGKGRSRFPGQASGVGGHFSVLVLYSTNLR